MPLFYDATYILVIIGGILSIFASLNVQRTFNRYSKIRSQSRLTGGDTARHILQANDINDVTVHAVSGSLTDHYSPLNKRLALSQPVMNVDSLAAVGVAAHEVGHALQHAKGYAPLQMRSALVPVVNISSQLSWPIIMIGLIFHNSWSSTILNIGLVLFALTTIFTLITLPVEFNASRRALKTLSETQILSKEELKGTKKVLNAAAMTYVASAATSILSLLRILLLTRGRRNN